VGEFEHSAYGLKQAKPNTEEKWNGAALPWLYYLQLMDLNYVTNNSANIKNMRGTHYKSDCRFEKYPFQKWKKYQGESKT